MHLITNPNPQLESFVLSKLPEVKNDLAKFIRQLVTFAVEHALEPPIMLKEALPLWSPPLPSDLIPTLTDTTTDLGMMSTDLTPDSLTTRVAAHLGNNVGVSMEAGPHPTFTVPTLGSENSSPLAPAEHREGRLQRGLQSLKHKLQFRSRHEGRR
ncbi:hypothetical protein BJ165DRAFT_1612736 [Panaeolus papilionaceus]|nr:hypothetical protein BJ165DRAFT_1612736 [Panaeolus papilionaceus]